MGGHGTPITCQPRALLLEAPSWKQAHPKPKQLPSKQVWALAYKGWQHSLYQYFRSSFCAGGYRKLCLRPAGDADSPHCCCFADHCSARSSLPLPLLLSSHCREALPHEFPSSMIERRYLPAHASCPRSLPSPRLPRSPCPTVSSESTVRPLMLEIIWPKASPHSKGMPAFSVGVSVFVFWYWGCINVYLIRHNLGHQL